MSDRKAAQGHRSIHGEGPGTKRLALGLAAAGLLAATSAAQGGLTAGGAQLGGDLEEVGGSYPESPRSIGDALRYFADATQEAGLCTTPGCAPVTSGSTQASGVLPGDFDGDGWVDILVLGRGIVPDALFVNQRDGTFVDEAAAWGVAETHLGWGGAVGDYDRDGDLDVFVTSHGPIGSPAMGAHRLYRNNGDRTFTDVAVAAGVNQNSIVLPSGDGAAFGDYDLDGDLDLYVASWQWWPTISMGNRLYRNEGDGSFTDVTVAAGVYIPFMGFSPTFADTTGDLLPDILVAGDFGLSKYFVNQGDGTFVERAKAWGAGLDSNGMGSAVADLDADGDLDWYVSSVHFGGTSEGNKLYINQGDGMFVETAEAAGVAKGGYGWGTVALDFDHDGVLDLIETNGWLGYKPKTKVWRGLGDGNFVPVTNSGLEYKREGRALVTLDYDHDGDLDVVIGGNQAHELRLFRSQAVQKGKRWLRVELDTSAAPQLAPNGVGSRVRVDTGSQVMYRTLHGGCNFGGQNELAVHFGLGDVKLIPDLEVRWADGTLTVLRNVATNQVLTIQAP